MLTITINSFSFLEQHPKDPSGHGGGFVFDCRALPNPGRNDRYKHLSGLDDDVRDYLWKEPVVNTFLTNAKSLVCLTVDTYLAQQYTDLMVSFGCTGGQHRSVYCAEQLSTHLLEKYAGKIKLKVNHLNRDNWKHYIKCSNTSCDQKWEFSCHQPDETTCRYLGLEYKCKKSKEDHSFIGYVKCQTTYFTCPKCQHDIVLSRKVGCL